MPPPSASPQHGPNILPSGSLPRGPLPAPQSFAAPREPGQFSPAITRASNNMSISSIMGSDSPTISKSTPWPTNSHQQAPPLASNTHSSSNFSFKSQGEQPQAQQRTPQIRRNSATLNMSNPVSNGNRSPRTSHSMFASSPIHGRHGLPELLHPFQSSSAAQDSRPPHRPFSQPSAFEPQNHLGGLEHEHLDPNRNEGEEAFDGGRRTFGDNQRSESFVEKSSRDRSTSDLAGFKASSWSLQSPRFTHHPGEFPQSPGSFRRELMARQNPGDPMNLPRPDYQEIEADRPIASREGPASVQEHGPYFGPAGPPIDTIGQRRLSPTGKSSIGDHDHGRNGHSQPALASLSDSFQSRRSGLDLNLPNCLEESQMSHRTILNASQEGLARRLERASPLPQAVQGASSQPAGSGRAPSIKSEFGRMFSGLGSGVGSTPQPMPPQSNGSPTPGRQGLVADDDNPESAFGRTRHDDIGLGLAGGTRKGKRAFSGDGRLDANDGRQTPGYSHGRAGKRSKMGQSSHHHHHHPHSHQ